jgi:4-hydroxyacetophenone monooxygenase
MATIETNPHAGRPFTDDDATIAGHLEAVSIPALVCSLVHMTGDPGWIRGDIRPAGPVANDFQFGMSEQDKAEVRRRALPAIAAYRDGGCRPAEPVTPELAEEMMAWLAGAPLPEQSVPMFLDDLHLDGADSGRIEWGDEISPDARAGCPVVVIGCGESGLLAGIRLAQAGLPFTIVEKSLGPGGTWWDNRYPGARVDIGSHFYCYSFEPADHWSEYFVRQPELRDYFARVLEDHDLRPHCRFGTTVEGAVYDEASGRWAVTVTNPDGTTEVLEAKVLVSGVGALNQPRYPDIEGMATFDGPSFHSARWDDSVDLAGTRFALVGAGATGFQIGPHVAEEVAHLTVFQRTPQWMFPNPNYHRAVPPGDAWAMRHLPFYGRWFRFLMFYPGAGLSIEGSRVDPDFDDRDGRAISAASAKRRELLTAWMSSQLEGRPDLLAEVLPDYPTSAKRMLQDDGSWLACLSRDDVDLVRTPIERIVPRGIVTADGELHEADVICYATGFRHNDYLWPMEIVGRGGRTLRGQWGDEPTAYLGITVPNFPNLFCLYGPGTNLAHGASLIFQSECQVTYVMSAIHELLVRGARSMEPRAEVHDAYASRYQDEIAQMVWSHWSVEHSHFKNPDGRVFTLSPWPVPDYWSWTRAAEPDDFAFD